MEKNIHQSFVGTINNQSFNNETSYLATLSILSALEEKKQIGLGNNTELTNDLYTDVHKLINKYDYDVSSVVEASKALRMMMESILLSIKNWQVAPMIMNLM